MIWKTVRSWGKLLANTHYVGKEMLENICFDEGTYTSDGFGASGDGLSFFKGGRFSRSGFTKAGCRTCGSLYPPATARGKPSARPTW